MKKNIVFLFIPFFCGCLISDPPPKSILIRNSTDSAIYVYYSFNDSIESSRELVLFENNRYGGTDNFYSPNYRVNAYSIGGIGITGRKKLVDCSRDKKLRLFFINEVTMREKSWKQICESQIYSKKVILSVSELKRLDWIVEYP